MLLNWLIPSPFIPCLTFGVVWFFPAYTFLPRFLHTCYPLDAQGSSRSIFDLFPESWKDQKPLEPDEKTHWATYWTICIVTAILELSILRPVYLLFPFYTEIKILFFLWLGLDEFQGAGFFWLRFLKPAVLKLWQFFSENRRTLVSESFSKIEELKKKWMHYKKM